MFIVGSLEGAYSGVNFLLVLIELFSLGVTNLGLRLRSYGRKSKMGVLKAGVSVCAKFSRR